MSLDESAEKRALIDRIHAQRDQWAFEEEHPDGEIEFSEFPRSQTVRWALDHPNLALTGLVAIAIVARRPLAKIGVFAAGIAARRWIARLG